MRRGDHLAKTKTKMKRESKAERKFNLIRRITELGFTYEEAHALRRIEMTLHRWAEAECNGEIERDETTGKPERVSRAYINGMSDKRCTWRIVDREAGALKRLKAIVDARNGRERSADARRSSSAGHVYFYHQTDPRGCALYLLKRSELPEGQGETMPSILSRYYTRGLAVCA